MGYLLHIPTLRRLEGKPLMTEDFSTKEKALESIKHYHYLWWPKDGMFYLGKYERYLIIEHELHLACTPEEFMWVEEEDD